MKPIERRDLPSIALLAGAGLLLFFNLAVGATRGFARPDAATLVRVLSAPGVVLGWGGVLLLGIAFPYALLGWLRGRNSGRLLSIGGALFAAVAFGALAAVFTSPPAAGGGVIGGAIGGLVHRSLGTAFACVALLLIAIPSLMLSLAPLVLETGIGRAVERASTAAFAGLSAPRAWYPERHVSDEGDEEEPVQFVGSHDVGPIRFRDDSTTAPTPEPAASTVSLSPPAVSGPAVRKQRAIPGIRYADGGTDEEPVAPSHVPDAMPVAASLFKADDDRLPAGVRYAAPLAEPTPPEIEFGEPAAFATPEPVAFAESSHGAMSYEPADAMASTPAAAFANLAPTPDPVVLAALAIVEPSPAPVAPPAEPAPVMAPAAVIAEALPAAAPSPPPEPVVASTQQTASVLIAIRPPVPAPPAAPASDDARRPIPRVAIAPMTPRAAVAAALDLGEFDAEEASTATAVAEPPASGAAYRRKLASTGLIEGPRADDITAMPKTVRARPKPSKPKNVHDAIRGLFSSLPLEELPPTQPVIEAPEPAAEPPVEAPGQTGLFDAPKSSKRRSAAPQDPLFAQSVEAAIERGSASLVLLKRKLGVGYARAASLIEALVAEGILGEMTASGSRPTLLSAAAWEKQSKSSK